MSDLGRVLFVALMGAWLVVLVVGGVLVRVRMRAGREAAWPKVMTIAPLVDLCGTWAGALAAAALLWGRRGYGWGWATALLLVALMVTASLYDRAVLVPSLDAAFKRLAADSEEAKWETEWAFLWRMASGARWGTVAAAIAAIACGLLA